MSYPIASFVGVVLGVAVVVVSVSWARAATEAPPPTTASFLQHAATGQQQEIDLGQLAIQKAGSDQVKQFGARMVADHQKARQEVRQLASAEGVRLERQPTDSQKQTKTQLTTLSGQDFDHAYMTAMLREHAKEMKALEQHALIEQNPKVREWAAGAVPVVKEHLTKATTIASSLGIPAGPPTK